MPAGLTTDEAIALLEGNLWSMWAQFGLGEGCHLVDEPDLMRFETPLAHVPYNSVLRFQADRDVDGIIERTLASYRDRHVPLVWLVHPTARPADLDERLHVHGLVEAEVVPGMVVRLDEVPAGAPVPDGIAVDEVCLGEEDPFIEMVAWRYALPADAAATLRSIMNAARFGEAGSPTRGWLARRDGAVVSKAVFHLDGRSAGLYGVATKPEARGLGLARLLCIRALQEARSSGAEVGVLHSTPMAVGLYRSLGFEPVADFRLFSTPDTLHL